MVHLIIIFKSEEWTVLVAVIFLCCCVELIAPFYFVALQWRHNGRDGVSNHQPRDCLFKRLFRCRSKKTSKLRVTGLCEGNSPVTGEFPAQRASNAEKDYVWWRHHEKLYLYPWKVESLCPLPLCSPWCMQDTLRPENVIFRYILSNGCLRWNLCSPLFCIQYLGLLFISSPIFLPMRILILHINILLKSEIWFNNHCLRSHDTISDSVTIFENVMCKFCCLSWNVVSS